jgi:hypothetical protein
MNYLLLSPKVIHQLWFLGRTIWLSWRTPHLLVQYFSKIRKLGRVMMSVKYCIFGPFNLHLLNLYVSLWLATFCWKKSLLCNDVFYTGMLFYLESSLQLWASRRLCAEFKTYWSVPLQPSRRRDIPSRHSTVQASFVRTMRTFRSDLPLCREVLNCSSLHPSGRLSSTAGRHSVFDQLWDFFPKHRYGKIAATVRTMWIPVRTRSFIRQVMRSKSRCPDTQALYMEIACIRSTVRTTYVMVQTYQALIWKLCTTKVWPSGR